MTDIAAEQAQISADAEAEIAAIRARNPALIAAAIKAADAALAYDQADVTDETFPGVARRMMDAAREYAKAKEQGNEG